MIADWGGGGHVGNGAKHGDLQGGPSDLGARVELGETEFTARRGTAVGAVTRGRYCLTGETPKHSGAPQLPESDGAGA